jgi:excisionase family DNA binding protein
VTQQDLLTPKQLTERLKVSNRTLARYIKEGLIPYIRIRGAIRFSPESISRLLKETESTSPRVLNETHQELVHREVLARSTWWNSVSREMTSFLGSFQRAGILSKVDCDGLLSSLDDLGKGMTSLKQQVLALGTKG